jgi:hypothetical protein
METRSKTKAVVQKTPSTSFVEEVAKTPPTIHHAVPVSEESPPPTRRMQQLAKEFPESKFPLPSKATYFSISVKEPDHPTPIPNPSAPKTPKPKTPLSCQTNELVLTIKKVGKMKSDTGKFCEPELFTGKDLKKLKVFIFQCQL